MLFLIWLNVFFLALLVSFPIVLELNKKIFKGKNKIINKALKNGRKSHPYVGVVVISIGAIHGYSMLGLNFILHTGSVLLILLLINGILGFLYKRKRTKILRISHRIIGYLIILAFSLHYFNPWFFS